MATVEAIYPHIEKMAGQPARLRRLPRIRVTQIVMDYVGKGWSAEEIQTHYPHLHLSEIHAALSFYYDHKAEIDQEIQDEMNQLAAMEQQGHQSPIYQALKNKGLI